MKMEAIRSSEKSVQTRRTQRHIPEDGIFHSHRRENLKSYIENTMFRKLDLFPKRRVFYFLEYRMMGKVQKPSNSV
jgi:hypothetical protein